MTSRRTPSFNSELHDKIRTRSQPRFTRLTAALRMRVKICLSTYPASIRFGTRAMEKHDEKQSDALYNKAMYLD